MRVIGGIRTASYWAWWSCVTGPLLASMTFTGQATIHGGLADPDAGLHAHAACGITSRPFRPYAIDRSGVGRFGLGINPSRHDQNQKETP